MNKNPPGAGGGQENRRKDRYGRNGVAILDKCDAVMFKRKKNREI